MKTKKGIVLTYLGDGGVCIRADFYKNGQNILISGQDYSPELLHKVIENLRVAKALYENIYGDAP